VEADALALPASAVEPGLGLRRGPDRRHEDRRHRPRLQPDRRRSERRKARLRTLLLAAATTLFAHRGAGIAPRPGVSVSIDEFRPVPPDEAYEDLIQEAAGTYDLDPALIRAVMQTESSFNPTVVSRVGAQGLMQLMPALAEEMGVRDSFDPRENIMGGARYLRELLDRFRGNVRLALASYNAGPTAVAKYGRVPPFRETQRYVKQIQHLIARDHADGNN
jgi:soluble lytic murein transglycosylase-like protein